MKLFKKIFKLLILLAFLLGLIWYAFSLRKPLFQHNNYASAIFDKNGTLLSATISSDEQWHFQNQGKISEKYVQAVIAFEDKRFYRHIGFDLKALLRAMKLNLKQRKVVSGGSTISMQTIRLHQGNPSRSLPNKIVEIILSTRLELKHSKDEILSLYASHAPYGGNVIGIDAACWRYFNKSPENISWAEACLLAVLPNSPGLIHTERNREKLKDKRDDLLFRLNKNGTISDIAYQGALIEEIPRRPKRLPQKASHYLNFAKKKTKRSVIYSTIDPIVQEKCNEIAKTESRKLKANFIDNIAILVLDIEDKTVVSYVGNVKGTGLENQEYTDMVQAQRSTGSILKPILYASSLDNGLISKSSFLPDYPFSIGGFITQNYNKEHTGLIPANKALQKSLNIPFAYLLHQYGIEKFRLFCQQMGLEGINKSSEYYGIPLILGGGESSLWELTHAYASMAKILKTYTDHDGYYEKAPIYKSVLQKEYVQKKNDQKELRLTKDAPILRAENIWQTFEQLKELKRPTEEGEWKQFSHHVPIAWKTGTSNGFKDAWAIGVNEKYAVGVWVGNSDGEGRPGIIGSIAAAPIFFKVINTLEGHRKFEEPIDDLVKIPFCKLSGNLANEFCPIDSNYISRSSSFIKQCTHHQQIFTDNTGSYKVNKNCYEGNIITKVETSIPIEVAYYYKQTQLYTPPLPLHPSCIKQENEKTTKIIYPEKNMQIYQPKIGEGERNKIVLRAHHISRDATLLWHLDDKFLGSTQKIHEMSILLKEGNHRLLIIDESGNEDACSFEILQ
jgi:penicillin-binding protein 1C